MIIIGNVQAIRKHILMTFVLQFTKKILKKRMMKIYKILLSILCLIFLGQINNTQAQTVIAKAEFFGLLSGQYGGGVELVINDQFSVMMNAAAIQRNRDLGIGGGVLTEKGYGIVPEFRYYLGNNFEEAPNGLFLGINYTYNKLEVDIAETGVDSLNLGGDLVERGLGFVAGYQWILNERIAVEFLVRPFVKNGSITGALERREDLYAVDNGFKFDRFGISVGLAF